MPPLPFYFFVFVYSTVSFTHEFFFFNISELQLLKVLVLHLLKNYRSMPGNLQYTQAGVGVVQYVCNMREALGSVSSTKGSQRLLCLSLPRSFQHKDPA